MHYILEGAIDQAKAEKALKLLLKNIARFLRHLKKDQKLATALKLRKNKPGSSISFN